MLTISTPIPTSLRGKIRALVKAHAGWHEFLAEKDIISASARNTDLIEFALRHPMLKTQIEQMLRNHSNEAAIEVPTKAAVEPSVETLVGPTLEAQIQHIERLLHQFYQRFPQQKPRIRVQAVLQAL